MSDWLLAAVGFGVLYVVGFKLWEATNTLGVYTTKLDELRKDLAALQAMENREFREKIRASPSVSLQCAYLVEFRLDEKFWRNCLHATEEELAHIRSHGRCVEKLRIERWLTHIRIELVMADSLYWVHPASDIVRSFSPLGSVHPGSQEVYSLSLYGPASYGEVMLWSLPLGEFKIEKLPRRLELRIKDRELILSEWKEKSTLFRIPIEMSGLRELARRNDQQADSMIEFEHKDEERGLSWNIRGYDFSAWLR